MQRILSLGNEHPDAIGFTIDDILKWPVFRLRNAKRNSVRVALYRFIKLGIVFSPSPSSSGPRLFKVKNSALARSYIEGDRERPWLSLAPTPSSSQFCEFDEHRDHFNVQLTKEWFERVKDKCEVNNNQYTFRAKAFTLSVNGKSYAGQLFTRPYWRTEAKRQIGDDFYQYLADKESKGGFEGDFCLPIGVKGQRFTIGGRPTQFSASHYPAQLDVRRSKSDSHIIEGLKALINQADFNTRTLDFEDAVLETLKRQGETQSTIAEAIQKLVRLFFPQSELPYQPSSEDGGDPAYR
jgi:hypothetical protein